MTDLKFILTDAPSPSEIDYVGGSLDQFNIDVTGIADNTPVAVLVRSSESNELVAGVTGRSSLGLLFLDLFFIKKDLRGSGLGTKMLAMFEEEGRRRNCVSAVLYTISFQAPWFYEKNGWSVFGEVPCAPEGTKRIYLSKALQ